MARIVLNTFGSFGDLHPYLALAIALRDRGHQATVATSQVYRAKIMAENVAFAPVRPDVGELLEDESFTDKLWHPKFGTELLIRRYLLPQLEQSYRDLHEACAGADLLIAHTAAYAGPVVAEALHIPWLSVALQPIVFFSSCDPPVIPQAAWLRHWYRFGIFPALLRFGELRTRSWAEPIIRLRKRAGVPPNTQNPFMRGQFSKYGTLALFSKHFAEPQRDWPAKTTVCGFVFYDRPGDVPGMIRASETLDPEVQAFIDAGEPPILFTLGSSAVMRPGNFFRESIEAAQRISIRAVLLVGPRAASNIPNPLPDGIIATGYAPYSEIMPKVAAVVHQGGIGTTAQALRWGRPMLVVPWAHDQPDNAFRLERLGVARTIARSKYWASTAVHELRSLLKSETYARRAAEMGKLIREENGVVTACEAIEKVLA